VVVNDHNRLIAEAAHAALSPLGVVRKGRSRTWLDDRGWCLTVVEFQPSSWARGTCLNVGLMLLWHPTDHFTFDIGYRIEDFDDVARAGFEAAVLAKAGRAAREVISLRQRFQTLGDVAAISR